MGNNYTPDGWEVSSLKELLSMPITDFGSFSMTNLLHFQNTGIPFIKSEAIHDNGIDFNEITFISRDVHQMLPKSKVSFGDILFTKIGAIGRVCIYNGELGECNSNAASAKIRVNSNLVHKEFLVHFLRSNIAKKQYIGTIISTPPRINLGQLNSLKIYIPSPSEQQRIANILDIIDNTIERTEQFIAKLKLIKTGLLHDLLTRGLDEYGQLRDPVAHPEQFKDTESGRIPKEWEICPIENKLHRIIDYRGKTPYKTNAGIPLVTARNVREGFLDLSSTEYIRESDYDKWMNRGIPSAGDILFTTEAPLGNVAQIPPYKVALSQRILTLCANSEVLDKNFLLWLLIWEGTQKLFSEKSTGSTVVGIKQSVFRKVKLQFPPLQEQIAINKVLYQHKVHFQSEESYLAKLKQLKKGLMDDLLTGKVRVKTDEG